MSRLTGFRTAAAAVLALVAAVDVSTAAETVVDAAKRADASAVRRLVDQRVDVNARQGDGATALHWAAYRDITTIADLLIRAGADVNVSDDLGITPLFLASENGSGPMVAQLLRAGANVARATLPSGVTPLMVAARGGAKAVVQALIVAGADVNAVESLHRQSALMFAVAQGHQAVVSLLIEHGADVRARSQQGQQLVNRGARYGSQNQTKAVLEVATGGFTPLLFAARQGDSMSAELLLKAHADPNDASADGTSALVVAAHSGNAGVARVLLAHGADPNGNGSGYTALHAAALTGDVSLVKALLMAGANPNIPLLHGMPVRRFSKDLALEDDFKGATPFWLAAKFAEPEIMQSLVDAGADPTIVIMGKTPLMLAAGLFSARVNTGSDRRERRLEPLQAVPHDVEERASLEAVKIALAHGANVNAVDSDGDTALHGAASRGFTSIIRPLVDAGADLKIKNHGGRTPLSVAKDQATSDLIRSLLGTN